MARARKGDTSNEPPAKRRDNGRTKDLSKRLPRRDDGLPLRITDSDTVAADLSRHPSPLSSHIDSKALWLSVLTREELTKLATGAEWKPGDPHPDKCFVCELANELLDCRQCCRSYHATCLDPPMEHFIALDNWACPACALLGAEGATHTYLLDQPYEEQDKRKMARAEVPPEITNGPAELGRQPSNAKSFQHQNKSIPQSGLTGRPRSGSTASSNEDSISLIESDFDQQLPPNMVDLTSFKKSGVPVDSGHQAKLKKRSRYTTLPSDVDEALAIINRQIEAGISSKNMLEHLTARNRELEQELQIEKGKALLAVQNKEMETELNAIRIQHKSMEYQYKEIKKQNQQLTSDIEKYLKKIKDLEVWKMRMKAMFNGESED